MWRRKMNRQPLVDDAAMCITKRQISGMARREGFATKRSYHWRDVFTRYPDDADGTATGRGGNGGNWGGVV